LRFSLATKLGSPSARLLAVVLRTLSQGTLESVSHAFPGDLYSCNVQTVGLFLSENPRLFRFRTQRFNTAFDYPDIRGSELHALIRVGVRLLKAHIMVVVNDSVLDDIVARLQGKAGYMSLLV
jgi:hypothetical protein